MLFVSLTRSGIQHLLNSSSAREFQFAPGWFLTCATDDFLSHISISPDEVVAWESPLGGAPEFDLPLISASYFPRLQTLEISKASVSGRPVYYCTNPKGEFFASTHIAWLRKAGVLIEEDRDTLPELLVYRLVTPPRTMFRGIRQLGLAGSLMVDLKDGNLRVRQTAADYDPPDLAPTASEDEAVWKLSDVLKTAVAKLAPAAANVATLLSGGVDSSILASIARDELSATSTFSTAYPFDSGESNAEQKYALTAAHALRTRHTVFVPNAADFLAGTVEAMAAAENPLNHLQSTLVHLLFKRALPATMDRVICGLAADSVLGLETQFALHQRAGLRRRFLSSSPVYFALRAIGSRVPKARELAAYAAQVRGRDLAISNPHNPIWSYAAFGDFDWVGKHYGPGREQVIAYRLEQLKRVARKSFDEVFAFYTLNYCDLAVGVSTWSKLGEAQNKILYYPFASQEVLDTSFSVPWEIKLKSLKHLARGVGRHLGVPDFILNRRKESFGIASDRWAERNGPLEPLVVLAAKAVELEQLRDLQGREPRKAMTLWSLLNYAVLIRLFVRGESKESLLSELEENRLAQKAIRGGRVPRTKTETPQTPPKLKENESEKDETAALRPELR